MAGTLPVTCVYAGLHAIEYLYLTFKVIGKRRSGKVPHGDGGDKVLARRIRVRQSAARCVGPHASPVNDDMSLDI